LNDCISGWDSPLSAVVAVHRESGESAIYGIFIGSTCFGGELFSFIIFIMGIGSGYISSSEI